jgi:hypothetical protein
VTKREKFIKWMEEWPLATTPYHQIVAEAERIFGMTPQEKAVIEAAKGLLNRYDENDQTTECHMLHRAEGSYALFMLLDAARALRESEKPTPRFVEYELSIRDKATGTIYPIPASADRTCLVGLLNRLVEQAGEKP